MTRRAAAVGNARGWFAGRAAADAARLDTEPQLAQARVDVAGHRVLSLPSAHQAAQPSGLLSRGGASLRRRPALHLQV
jgi:hypothetical protein